MEMRDRIRLIVTGIIVASLAFAFGVGLNVGAVETDGTVDVCVNSSGDMRVDRFGSGCSDSETHYVFEGELFHEDGGSR